MMDYDGANERQISKLGSSRSPAHFSDNSRIAFTSVTAAGGWQLKCSPRTRRTVTFPLRRHQRRPVVVPRRQPHRLLFLAKPATQKTTSPTMRPQSEARNHLRGPDVSPCWNPNRLPNRLRQRPQRLPQVFTMEADGTNPQR